MSPWRCQWDHSSAGLQLPTAPLGHGPCPAVGPHLGRASDSLCPCGGAWSTRATPCLQLPGSGDLYHLLHRIKGAQIWVCSILVWSIPGPANRGDRMLFLTARGFFCFPKLLTAIVYILQYYYSCYELPKAATSKYCRACVVPAQIIATNPGLSNLDLISLFK